jgi:3-oxoadipate enol-lactonase
MTLHHRFQGPENAPVLVLASSLGTTLELWDANVDSFAAHFRVLRYDHRGHGRSPVPPGPYEVADLADDVLGLLDAHELGSVSWCGISLGGAVGLWLAANAPERLDRLVVACSSARFGPAEGWIERARIVRESGLDAISDAVVERWFTPRLRRDEPGLAERFRAMLEETPREGYAACCEAIAGWDLRDRLGQIRVPTLVVVAEDDPATPPEHGRLLAEGIPGAELATISGAAHLANVEQPEKLSQLVIRYLAVEHMERIG